MDRRAQIEIWLQDKPNDAFLLYALATEFIAEQNDQEAEEIFNTLLKEHPSYYATYYHLGQLLERKGEDQMAIEIYKRGMEVCEEQNNRHAYNELRSVLEELEF
jgi:uncharacterized protein HemY